MKKIAINGFGRIGRLVMRGLVNDNELQVVAINDLTDAKTLAHLFKYDSAHGKVAYEVSSRDGAIIIDGREIKILSERDPANLPWKEMGVELVVESTGLFRTRETAGKHITAGAKKVIISAPAKGAVDATIVPGVNDDTLQADHLVVSNASCTTNCLAPIMKVIVDNFGVENCFMTTIHSYTNDQCILDYPHSDLRRGRSAAVNIIPTTTGAAIATGKVIPELKGKINGMAVRVPTVDGSLVDVTINAKKAASVDEVNACIKKAAENELKGIIEYSDEPLVSSDIIGNPASSIFDSLSTMVDGKMFKLLSWYDNERGYSERVIDLARKMLNM